MNQNVDRKGSVTRKRGPVWKAKVRVFTVQADGTPLKSQENKLWKIKEILN